MTVIIEVSDLEKFVPGIDPVKAEEMIKDILAWAEAVAPCITDPEFPYGDAVKAILRNALLRWNDSGSGAITQWGAGQYQQSIDTRQPRKAMLTPTDIAELQKLCRKFNGGTGSSGAFTVDSTPVYKAPELHPLQGAWVNGPTGWAPGSWWGRDDY